MQFSKQDYWSGLPYPSPGDLPNPGIEPRSPALQADSLPSEPPRKPLDHNKLWKILKEMGVPDHLTCLLRNLHVGQDATVLTGRGTIDWFKNGNGVLKAVYFYPTSLTY